MRLLFVGFGVVGQGLAELLVEKGASLEGDHGMQIQAVGISDAVKGSVYGPEGIDLRRALQLASREEDLARLADGAFSGDAVDMIDRAEGDVMVEVTPTDLKTAEPATTHIRHALERGMHVVTTNKGPPALRHRELLSLARANGVRFLFEGTVMSGTPVLSLLSGQLAGCTIREMRGILNGTTNFMLTQMEGGLGYADALRGAQRAGYTEAVPDADVKGWDVLAKVTILANVAFDAALNPWDLPCQGIEDITPADVEEARGQGMRYKLLGRVAQDDSGVTASVGPERVELTHPLAAIGGVTNALTVSTDSLGDVTIVGPGAGSRATGYALLSDLLAIGGEP